MASRHMSEAEVASDLTAALAKLRDGVEIVIERDNSPIAVLKSSKAEGPGRSASECIALAKAYEARLGYAPVPDPDFVADLEAAIEEHRDLFEPPEWD